MPSDPNRRPIPHGTPTGYDTYGCRQDCCRVPKLAYERGLRERKQNWAYVDEVAVERACKGDRSVTLTPYEMRAAFDELERRGCTARQIADRLGVTPRSVVRWRNGHVTRPQGRERRASA